MEFVNSLSCSDEARKVLIKEHLTLNGIDYIEVPDPAQKLLQVFLIPKANAAAEANRISLLQVLASAKEKFAITGGGPLRQVNVEKVNLVNDHLEVEVSDLGDFSPYTLSITHEHLDPAYSQCSFSFKAGCPVRFDCKPSLGLRPEAQTGPVIDYLAKDYASFRQALLDRIPHLAPDWQDRHEADLGMALIEALAYAGDHLSYFQDAVANEAYLETARQRVSVRRHSRLIDYTMHEGAGARVFVHLQVAGHGKLPEDSRVQFFTRLDPDPILEQEQWGSVIQPEEAGAASKAAEVFEAFSPAGTEFHQELNEILLHTWGNRQCCLSSGGTVAYLVGDLTGKLQPGGFLLLEEVQGLKPGLAPDPGHCQVVRIQDLQKTRDPLLDLELTRVTWASEDGLEFSLCLACQQEDGSYRTNISVARGNLLLADHGCTIQEQHQLNSTLGGRRSHRLRLREGPLSFRVPLPAGFDLPNVAGRWLPAKTFQEVKPELAEPQVTLRIIAPAPAAGRWEARPSLLESGPFHPHFLVETDNYGRACLRFGDGQYGRALPDASEVEVTYRLGGGRLGNVGRGALAHVCLHDAGLLGFSITAVYNPRPAWGGTDPEPMEQVKLLAPAAFHAELFRAVTEDDYARAAEKHPQVSKATATFRWTGSWLTVFLTIDPKGQTGLSVELQESVRAWVSRYTLAGFDLEIEPPEYVPVALEIDVCVSSQHFRSQVEEALLAVLSNGPRPDNKQGFFHPDNFTFGQPLFLSKIYEAVGAVAGVEWAEVTRFSRQGEDDPEPQRPASRLNLDRSFLPVGRLEVIRLDNDPNFPENGLLHLHLRGGK